MKPEQLSYLSPEVLLEEFDQTRPVLMIVDERRDVDDRSTYDRFMYDYVGDPLDQDGKVVTAWHPELGEVTYDRRRLKEYSHDGHLMVIWENTRADFKSPHRYYVAVADLGQGSITPYFVSDVKFIKQARGSSNMELVLSDRWLADNNEAQTASSKQIDSVKFVLAAWRRAASDPAHANQSSVVLTADGCKLKKPGNLPSVDFCHDIEQLHKGLIKYKKLEMEAELAAKKRAEDQAAREAAERSKSMLHATTVGLISLAQSGIDVVATLDPLSAAPGNDELLVTDSTMQLQ